MKKLLILFLIATTTISVAQESAVLRVNYNKGDKYLMKMNQTMNSQMMMMNNATEMSMEVVDVEDGVFTSEMRITKMVMDIMQGGMQMSYDSSKKADEVDQMGQMLKAQVDPMLTLVITAKTNEFGKAIETKVEPASVPGAEQFKNQSNISYPKEAVTVGTTWKDESENQGLKTVTEYKVIDITADKVMLSASGEVSGAGTGTINGNFEIDRKTGLPLKYTLKNDMKVQGQDMKMDIEITMEKM